MTPKERFFAFMRKEHTIVLDWKKKFFIGIIILSIFVFILPFLFVSEQIQGFNDRIFLYCSHPKLHSCEQLEEAYPFCYDAKVWFELKNCTPTKSDTNTGIEDFLKPYN